MDALPELISQDAMELFEKYSVPPPGDAQPLTRSVSKQYTRSIGVEARSTLEIAATAVLPAAVRYQTEVALNLGAIKAAGVEVDTASARTRYPVRSSELRSAMGPSARRWTPGPAPPRRRPRTHISP